MVQINLTLDTLGDRIWHVNLLVKLMPCPPGLKPTRNSSHDEDFNTRCECSAGVISCDHATLNVTIKSQYWIGKLNESEEYLVGLCPPAFCQVTNLYVINLPTTEDYNKTSISSYICSKNRTDVMCGRCVKDFGPSVNSLHYECVECSNINLAVNIAKYVASIYIPLATLFTVLIVFDIRLTTGPANAFILYCQVVSSTFNLDADGQIPGSVSAKSYQSLLNAYRVTWNL